MAERDTNDFKVLKDIYNGDIIYCDKKLVNKTADKLLNEVAKIWEDNDNKVVEELVDKYTEIISILEVESFAKGVAFMKELSEDVKKVLI